MTHKLNEETDSEHRRKEPMMGGDVVQNVRSNKRTGRQEEK